MVSLPDPAEERGSVGKAWCEQGPWQEGGSGVGGYRQAVEEGCKAAGEVIYVAATLHGTGRLGTGHCSRNRWIHR